MGRPKQDRTLLRLDKVERNKIKEMLKHRPEYEGLELYQVAHLLLKEKLFNDLRNLKKKASSLTMALTSILVRLRPSFYGILVRPECIPVIL